MTTIRLPTREPTIAPYQYRRATAALLLRMLLSVCKPRSLVDPTEGSGTSRELAEEAGVNYTGLDLATGFDLVRVPLAAALPERTDLVFLHPPYYRVLPYSGDVWGDAPDCRDLSWVRDWGRYVARLLSMIRNAGTGVARGGRLVVLLGDVRVGRRVYSPRLALGGQLHRARLVRLPRLDLDADEVNTIVSEYALVIHAGHFQLPEHPSVTLEVHYG